MLFPTFEFFFFFTIALVLNWFLKRWPFAWRAFLLIASYVFYSVWDIRFLLILIFVSIFNFLTAKAIYKGSVKSRKPMLALAIGVDVAMLGIFKYYDFFRVTAETFLSGIGLRADLPFYEIILPVGLSFYIFRAISYDADVYSGKIKPESSLLDFSIYIAFFPQLLSGPIARAGEFLPQLKNGGARGIEDLYGNFTLIFLGLFKKLVISSYLAMSLVDDIFAVPENHSSLAISLAVFAYSLVIYFDFSGYSDMAVGFSGLMGFKSPVNFNVPYLATNIRDFWRRWHISLSEWVRDYIYFPLGGDRKGKFRKYLNLVIAMALVGLWHGAAIGFVVWGLIHGFGVAGSHYFKDKFKTDLAKDSGEVLFKKTGNAIRSFAGWFATFSFISFSWVFFKSENIEGALGLLKTLFFFERLTEPIGVYVFLVIALGFLLILFEQKVIRGFTAFQEQLPAVLWFAIMPLFLLLLFKLGPDTIPPFVYFRF